MNRMGDYVELILIVAITIAVPICAALGAYAKYEYSEISVSMYKELEDMVDKDAVILSMVATMFQDQKITHSEFDEIKRAYSVDRLEFTLKERLQEKLEKSK